MLSLFIILILLIVIGGLLYAIRRLLNSLALYEDFIKTTYEIHKEAYERLIRVDAQGVFESDASTDSLGWIFDTIFNVMVAVRDQFMDEMPKINYETKPPKGTPRRTFVKKRRTQFIWEQSQLDGDDAEYAESDPQTQG